MPGEAHQHEQIAFRVPDNRHLPDLGRLQSERGRKPRRPLKSDQHLHNPANPLTLAPYMPTSHGTPRPVLIVTFNRFIIGSPEISRPWLRTLPEPAVLHGPGRGRQVVVPPLLKTRGKRRRSRLGHLRRRRPRKREPHRHPLRLLPSPHLVPRPYVLNVLRPYVLHIDVHRERPGHIRRRSRSPRRRPGQVEPRVSKMRRPPSTIRRRPRNPRPPRPLTERRPH